MFYDFELYVKAGRAAETHVARVFEVDSRTTVCRKEFLVKGAALAWAENQVASCETSLAELRAQAEGNTFNGKWGA